MPGETVAFQSEALTAIAAELRRQANQLRSLKDGMDGVVQPNTARWVQSGSVPAQEYETARRAIDLEIQEVAQVADLFSGITDDVNALNVDGERINSQIVGLA